MEISVSPCLQCLKVMACLARHSRSSNYIVMDNLSPRLSPSTISYPLFEGFCDFNPFLFLGIYCLSIAHSSGQCEFPANVRFRKRTKECKSWHTCGLTTQMTNS
uniref:Uncharacterized protein n=1 Tax=Mus musculus TaxID=10090 RepID=Q9D2A3_MOUSE|nr:RIKEN cDNA 5330439B14 gene [Mus musculus]AAI47457.1 RIKEN cDNA 5330439B14 gene [Mus musculus]BAB31925.1 unnamed protein product [Mus musculus]